MKLAPIEVTYFDKPEVQYDGRTRMNLRGRTEQGTYHDVTLILAPYAVGTLAERLHAIVREQQSRLNAVFQKLRGENR